MINNIYLFVILLMPWIITAGCLIGAYKMKDDYYLSGTLYFLGFIFFFAATLLACVLV